MPFLTSGQFMDWMAYAQVEPFGERHLSYRLGLVCATVANVNRGKGKPPLKPEDFMIEVLAEKAARPVEKQTPQQQKEILMALVKATKKNPKAGEQWRRAPHRPRRPLRRH